MVSVDDLCDLCAKKSSAASSPRHIHFNQRRSEICEGAEFFFPPRESRCVFNLTSCSPVRYNCRLMALYATLSRAHPLPTSVSWRHYVHETLKTDIQDEAVTLLKTKGQKVEFTPWRSRYSAENRSVNKNRVGHEVMATRCPVCTRKITPMFPAI